MTGFAIVVVVVLVYAWKWHSLTGLAGSIQPVGTASTRVTADRSAVLFCDFANHYYPQG
jgi:hypothetical protein